MNVGYLPGILTSARPRRLLEAYVGDYLREEIAAERVVRDLPIFGDFLRAAALSEGGLVNYSNIARECAVSGPTVKSYFGALEDTLLGRWLPAFRRRAKRRVIHAPKFYFADVGVVNVLARRGQIEPGSELFGRALENWVFHELSAYIAYREIDADLSYWRLASGVEVDFVLGDMDMAVEVKGADSVTPHHTKGLRYLAEDHPEVRVRVLVCTEKRPRVTTDGILVLPAQDFARRLWEDQLLP